MLAGSSGNRNNFVDICMVLLLFHLSGQLSNEEYFSYVGTWRMDNKGLFLLFTIPIYWMETVHPAVIYSARTMYQNLWKAMSIQHILADS